MRRPPTDLELVRHALEVARHELATLHGLIAFDGAAPSETFAIDTSAARASVDEALALWVGRGMVEPKPAPAIVPDHKGWPPPPPPPRAPNVDPGTSLPPRAATGHRATWVEDAVAGAELDSIDYGGPLSGGEMFFLLFGVYAFWMAVAYALAVLR